MGFEDALADLSTKVREYSDSLTTEEATKTAIIMPFISRVLGYDVFNPQEVVPEFIADVGLKKGEKIDFAIMRDGQVQMLIEAKKIGDPLNLEHASQLVRYFHVSNARIAILTNGREWHFYTDLDKPNKMDEKPFLRLDLLEIDAYGLPELQKLTKETFDLESVLLAAEELKYVSALKREIGKQFSAPTDDFVKILAQPIWDGMYTQRARELFAPLAAKALAQFINDAVNDRLKSALGGTVPRVAVSVSGSDAADADATETEDPSSDGKEGIETTPEELEGFNIVRAIVASDVPYSRVTPRDQRSYFAILLDNNNRKPICRLHFNRKQMYVGLFDSEKVEHREPVDEIEQIYTFAEQLRETVRRYT